MALILPCSCECHHYCHTCGVKLLGPNDIHLNCADTLPKDESQLNYKGLNPLEPWPTNEAPEAFTDYEREGYGDHAPVA